MIRWFHSLEYSWLFVQPSLLDDEKWFRAATLMAQAHQQDSFLLRTTGNPVASLHGADGGRRRPAFGVDAILSEAKAMTYLRLRGENVGGARLRAAFRSNRQTDSPRKGRSFVAHQTTRRASGQSKYACTRQSHTATHPAGFSQCSMLERRLIACWIAMGYFAGRFFQGVDRRNCI